MKQGRGNPIELDGMGLHSVLTLYMSFRGWNREQGTGNSEQYKAAWAWAEGRGPPMAVDDGA